MKFFPHCQYANTWVAQTRSQRFSFVINKEADGWVLSATDHLGKISHFEKRNLKTRSAAETLARKVLLSANYGKFTNVKK